MKLIKIFFYLIVSLFLVSSVFADEPDVLWNSANAGTWYASGSFTVSDNAIISSGRNGIWLKSYQYQIGENPSNIDLTINVYQNNNLVATKTNNHLGALAVGTLTFTKEDYSSLLYAGDDLKVEITSTSGGVNFGSASECSTASGLFTSSLCYSSAQYGGSQRNAFFGETGELPVIAPIIQTNLTPDYNSTDISISLNTSSNTNMSYRLDDGVKTLICSDCNQTILNLFNLSQINHSIQWYSELGNDLQTFNQTFINDIDPPTVEVLQNITTNDFIANFSLVFNVTDNLSGLDTCTLNLTYQENISNPEQYDKFIGCFDTTVFEAAGNYTGVLIATDNAGNSITYLDSGIVDPFVQVNFLNETGQNISNYNSRIFHPSGFIESFTNISNPLEISPLFNGSLDLGNYTIEFSKNGFVSSNVTIPINETSGDISYNFTMIGARIELTIFDQITKNLLTGENLTLDLIGPVSLTNVSSTGFFNLSSYLIEGEYQAFITSENYISNQQTFIFDGRSIFTSDFYLLPFNATNTGFVILVTYKEDNTFFPEITVTANEWDTSTSTYIQTYETQTNTNGQAVVPLVLENEIYKFCAEYPSGTTCFPSGTLGQVISSAQNGEIIPILPELFFPLYDKTQDDLTLNILNETLTNYSSDFLNYSLYYTWTNNLGLSSTVCTKINKNFNYTQQTVVDTCSTSSNGIYVNNFLLNNSFSYLVTIYDQSNDIVLYENNIKGKDNLFYWLDNFNLTPFIAILIIALMIGVIRFLKSPILIIVDVIFIFVLGWRYVIPQNLSIITVGIIIVMGIITLRALGRK